MSQLDSLLTFDDKYIEWQRDLNVLYYQKSGQHIRPWSHGEIYDSMKGLMVLGGKKVRTPGQYYEVDPLTGRTTDRPLQNTNEHIHPCVRIRIETGGLGTEDQGAYNPTALQGFSVVSNELSGKNGKAAISASQEPLSSTGITWVKHDDSKGRVIAIPEDGLGDVELELKRMLPEA